MKPSVENFDRLEKLIEQVLREQPLRQAPPDLEARVFAGIERLAARPWWRKSFAYWPMAARVIFIVASAGFVKLGFDAVKWLMAPLNSAARAVELPHEVSWIETFIAAIATIGQHLPPLWIYGALGLLAVMYVALFGISAAAYRTLYATR